ncbi:MAG: hypothetical protein FWD94_02845 [Treponema sp.]|nr:hypothetical protein [Treponema sp.]
MRLGGRIAGTRRDGIPLPGIPPCGIEAPKRRRPTVAGIIREWRAGAGSEDGREAAEAIERLAMGGDPTAWLFRYSALPD